MKDFASYSGGNKGEGAEALIREAQELAAHFDGASENDMLRAVYARAVEGKRKGTLTNEQIDAFYAQFAPMLDGAKQKKLRRVIEQLKNM